MTLTDNSSAVNGSLHLNGGSGGKTTNGKDTASTSAINGIGGKEGSQEQVLVTTATTADTASFNPNNTSTSNINHDCDNKDKDTRFGGLAARVEESIASSINRDIANKMAYETDYFVKAEQLGALSDERSRLALADLLETAIRAQDAKLGSYGTATATAGEGASAAAGGGGGSSSSTSRVVMDSERIAANQNLCQDVLRLVARIRESEASSSNNDAAAAAAAAASSSSKSSGEHSLQVQQEADKNADMAANVLAEVLLHSNVQDGIDPREVEHRRTVFGTNAITAKRLDSFLVLCWDAVQDFVLVMLIVLGIISIVVEVTTHEGSCTTCWIEGFAILVSVCIVVLVTASIDYAKQFAFIRLTQSLHETNTKAVIRGGKQISVIDDDIVVGDILSVNSHNLASIPADCVLLGPPASLKMDESTLTGESVLLGKKPGDVILSGTTAAQGSGKMVVIAVGVNSVAGKIRARVYESEDHQDALGGGDDNSPLFVKLDLLAKQIGIAGTVAAVIAFVASCIIGLAINGDELEKVVDYLIVSITVLAVAVPEGLPLAVTLALAFSSNKMMKEQNLVKLLDATETMGCATTICTDKTGMYDCCLTFLFLYVLHISSIHCFLQHSLPTIPQEL